MLLFVCLFRCWYGIALRLSRKIHLCVCVDACLCAFPFLLFLFLFVCVVVVVDFVPDTCRVVPVPSVVDLLIVSDRLRCPIARVVVPISLLACCCSCVVMLDVLTEGSQSCLFLQVLVLVIHLCFHLFLVSPSCFLPNMLFPLFLYFYFSSGVVSSLFASSRYSHLRVQVYVSFLQCWNT